MFYLAVSNPITGPEFYGWTSSENEHRFVNSLKSAASFKTEDEAFNHRYILGLDTNYVKVFELRELPERSI